MELGAEYGAPQRPWIGGEEHHVINFFQSRGCVSACAQKKLGQAKRTRGCMHGVPSRLGAYRSITFVSRFDRWEFCLRYPLGSPAYIKAH